MNEKLEKAVSLGDLQLTKTLIEQKVELEGKDRYGRTLIYDAIEKEYFEIVGEFCSIGMNLNNQDNKGKTPLHFACINYNLEIVKILLEFGVDVNLKDINGNIPLFDAIFNSKGNSDIIIILMENKSDYLIPNNHGVSPKDLANTIANFDVSYLFK